VIKTGQLHSVFPECSHAMGYFLALYVPDIDRVGHVLDVS